MPLKDKAARQEYQRRWIAQRRADFFADKKCKDCGSIDRLELDHIDPSKKITHRVWSWSESRRDAEIAKCQILCHDCHVKKTTKNKECPHGEQKNLKLFNQDIIDIRAASAAGESYRSIAQRYGVDFGWIGHIVRGSAWEHLK